MKDNTLLYIGIGAAALYFIFKNNEQGPASAPQVTATNQGGATVLPTQTNPLSALISAGTGLLNVFKGQNATQAPQTAPLTTVSTTGTAGNDIFGNPPSSPYYGIEPNPAATTTSTPAPAALTVNNSLIQPATITNSPFIYTEATDETSGVYDSEDSYGNEG